MAKLSKAQERDERIERLITAVMQLVYAVNGRDKEIANITRERDRWQHHAEALLLAQEGVDADAVPDTTAYGKHRPPLRLRRRKP